MKLPFTPLPQELLERAAIAPAGARIVIRLTTDEDNRPAGVTAMARELLQLRELQKRVEALLVCPHGAACEHMDAVCEALGTTIKQAVLAMLEREVSL